MECWHLTFSTSERCLLLPSEAQRREAVWRMGELLGDRLVVFCVADDHAHVTVLCEPGCMPFVRRALALRLRSVAGVHVVATGAKRVEHRRHLESLVPYTLRQTEHHDMRVEPAVWSGSCFQDLVGARCIPCVDLQLRRLLPRWTDSAVWACVGLPVLEPASSLDVRVAGAVRVARAAADAVGVDPDLPGRSVRVARARRVAMQVGTSSGIAPEEMRWATGISGRSKRRSLRADVDPPLHRAVRLQIAIANAVTDTRKRAG